MTAEADSPTHPKWDFLYWYDASDPATPKDRYSHSKGNGDEVCSTAGFPDGEPCQVYNIGGATWVMDGGRDYPATKCCKFELPRAHGAILPDWMQRSGAVHTGHKTVNGVASDVWVAQGAYDNNYAQSLDQRLPAGAPVRFWELKKGKLKAWDFITSSFVGGPAAVPQGTFTLPAPCQSARACL
eukprot:CAMPEP_0170153070 /NCGR_PEP_ID=MMETSP0033_2-20121228/54257_1 /TAXON_ID=195969 /ORGANISM="Dolichomastix tenuilepis, Strain CCMP3274" /LENGTH=183 /DNA_ID=CAMNT_0010390259 /DNA_START=31 /DNA_END=582 /DNA_ORIENTATION=+